MTRDVSKCDLKSLLRISLILLDEHLGSVFEVWQHIHLNIEKLLEDIFGLSLDHVIFTGDANFIEFDSCQLFDPLQEFHVAVVVESDANTRFSHSCSST